MSAISAVWVRASGMSLDPLRVDLESALPAFGSDRRSSVSSGGVALSYCGGHNALPEDRFDQQPLWSHDGSACLVADVRLDNRADLARELQLTKPEELADAAILLEAWLRWGSTCLDHLTGAFAFAVWTPSRQELFAARDHTGERPLFYTRSYEFFALSSTTRGLLALPGVSRNFNEAHLAEWLTGSRIAPALSFNISRLCLRAISSKSPLTGLSANSTGIH
jgi:asparagine synthase (glutamine-hydrolysing)